MRREISKKVTEAARREWRAAVPAAMRAAGHAGRRLFKKFSEEFPKEGKKL